MGARTAAIVGRGDADDGVAAPSHSQRAADNLRVAAERALPVAVAEHHHRMAAPRDIVLGQNGPAELRLDAEERKRASRHRLAHDGALPCPRDRSARGERRRGDAAEDLGRALAQVLDVRVRHRIEPPPAFGFVDVDERLGLHERGVAEEHRVDDAEDRCVGADADRERQHGHRREARMAAQRAQAVADVAREILDWGGTELVPRPLAHLFHAAESDQRLSPRFVRCHAGAAVLLDLLLDMEADLVVEPVLEFPAGGRANGAAATRQRAHPSALSAHGRHVQNEVDRARHAPPLCQRLVQVPPPARGQ